MIGRHAEQSGQPAWAAPDGLRSAWKASAGDDAGAPPEGFGWAPGSKWDAVGDWMYAQTWQGPWSGSCSRRSYCRRREWRRAIVPLGDDVSA